MAAKEARKEGILLIWRRSLLNFWALFSCWIMGRDGILLFIVWILCLAATGNSLKHGLEDNPDIYLSVVSPSRHFLESVLCNFEYKSLFVFYIL